MSQQFPKIFRVNCGEACVDHKCSASEINLLHKDIGDIAQNITIGYSRFLRDADVLPPKILDLLQIAAYVFCSDRMASRGNRRNVDYNSWSRSFEFFIPVLNLDFWNDPKIKSALNEALTFMTGDRNYEFTFLHTNNNPAEIQDKQLSLFSSEYQYLQNPESFDIMLFSGGLDSLAGTVQHLNEHKDRSLCVVCHESNNTVTHTQNALIETLRASHGNRVNKYGFKCCNHDGLKTKDETQRTRMFLFSAIAFSLCQYYDKHSFFVYENGITSINLSKQADIINARASRTTHPKTLWLLRKFYRLFDSSFEIFTPYYNSTKTEVIKTFQKYGSEHLIRSAVSCSSSRRRPGQVPHCGCCSQCIDRRFSMFSAGLEDYDADYASDFVKSFPNDDNNETMHRIYSALRLASLEDIPTPDSFFKKYPDDITDLISHWPGQNVDDKHTEIYNLLCRHGDSVLSAAKKMRDKYDNLKLPITKNSLIGIISERKYLQTPIYIRVEEINAILSKAIPDMFQREPPKNENDLNDKLHSILNTSGKFTREYPVIQFGITSYKADQAQDYLLIESKYVRDTATPSVASEGIAADITKIPEDFGIMFVIYDPGHRITDDNGFITDFELRRKDCYVRIYR